MTIRDSLSRHFGTPMQAMGFPQYLSYLNSAGKITQRSLLELLIILCEQVEAEEKRKKIMDADQIRRDETPISLFNPLNEDFTIEEKDDNNNPIKYTIPSLEIATFPAYQANIIKKHLIDALVNDRGIKYATPEQRDGIEKEVLVS